MARETLTTVGPPKVSRRRSNQPAPMPTPRHAALASLLLVAACSASPRTTIVVQPGVELICTARVPDVASPPAPIDASTPVDAPPPVDASTPADAVVAIADAPPPPVDPSRLVLLPAEQSWSVGRVARCEGARAVVLLPDGAVVARSVAALRAPRLPQGAEVMALWGEGAGEPYHAVVLDTDRAGVRVRYDDESEERLAIHRIQRVMRASSLGPAVGACSPSPGALAAVLVPEAATRRVAVVIEAGGPSVLVETLRDGRVTVPAAGLSRAVFAAGDRVMVRWRDSGEYAARVDRADGDGLAVTYDDGSQESIHPAQVLSWSAPEGTSRTLPPFR